MYISAPTSLEVTENRNDEGDTLHMKLAHFYRPDGSIGTGIVLRGRLFDLKEFEKEFSATTTTRCATIDRVLLEGELRALQQKAEQYTSNEGLAVESLRLASPVLSPEKILLVAVNYVSHSREQDAKPPSEPYFFTKFVNALIGPGDPIIAPKVSKKVDWEVELAAVIGKRGKNISKADSMEYIAGYTISNDVSFRDYQFQKGYPENINPLGHNWVKGKGLDNAFPLGPWLVTPDEIVDPYDLEISLSVNGEVKQKSETSEMVFRLDALIEYASAGMTLRPGDVVSTGTPLGVAAFTGQPYLKDGNIVEARIEKIGVLRNPVVAERNDFAKNILP
jgi:2-keto-4-pentenoate hydratase/2-oxohepta-3-ene-1,7-dioic acid hydratase in catechol pathway